MLQLTVIKDLPKNSPLKIEVLGKIALLTFLVQQSQTETSAIRDQQINSIVHELYLFHFETMSKDDRQFMQRLFKQCKHWQQRVFLNAGYED